MSLGFYKIVFGLGSRFRVRVIIGIKVRRRIRIKVRIIFRITVKDYKLRVVVLLGFGIRGRGSIIVRSHYESIYFMMSFYVFLESFSCIKTCDLISRRICIVEV